MKTARTAIMVSALFATAAEAETAERAVFASTEAKGSIVTQGVNRATQATVAFETVKLPKAGVRDVDKDGDGEISFAELLRHDLKSDF